MQFTGVERTGNVVVLLACVVGVLISGAVGADAADVDPELTRGGTSTEPAETRGRARFVVTAVGNLGSGPGTVVEAGEPIAAGGRITNEGNATGTQTVRIFVDGDPVGNETVTLAPGESVEVTERVVPTAQGRYGSLAVRVTTANDSMTQSISVHSTPSTTPTVTDDDPSPTRTTTDPRTPTSTERSPPGKAIDGTTTGGGQSGFGLPVALFACVLVAVVLCTRRSGDT